MDQKTTVIQRINIAIDGFSACGKSTLAKDLARVLDYVFVDSGAMYRAATLFALRRGFMDEDGYLHKDDFIAALPEMDINFQFRTNFKKSHVYLNGSDVEEEIRKSYIAKRVSTIASIPELRQKLVKLQQEMGARKGVVMDGRDIGTVVFPDAELKLFITATIDERVKRRLLEMRENGQQISRAELKKDLEARDHQDMTRTTDPLTQAKDAKVIDNTDLSREEQLDLVLEMVNKTLASKK